MKKIAAGGALVVGLIFASFSHAAAEGRWESQVTGGVVAEAGGVQFSLDVSSRVDGDEDAKGQVQYVSPTRSLHVAVECVYVDEVGNVTLAGPTKVQEGTWGTWTVVEIREDGGAVRVHSSAGDNCGETGSYPGQVVEGSFNIRT